jgi:N-acetylmuramoyl-L-alanine amidase CwlD
VAAILLLCARPAPADESAHVWFAGTRLIFDAATATGGELAVSTGDSGLARFLGRVGATLSWDASQRNIVITSADHRLIRFTLGDNHYSVGSVLESAAFVPYAAGGQAFLPFYALARALGVEPVRDAGDVVLQPQIYALEVKSAAKQVTVTVHAATPIRFKTAADGDRLVLTFGGVSSSLEQSRRVDGSPGTIAIVPGGSARGPVTVMTFDGFSGLTPALASAPSPNVVVLVFAASAVAGTDPVPPSYAAVAAPMLPITVTGLPQVAARSVPPPAAAVAPAPPPQPQAAGGVPGVPPAATLTAVDETAVGDGLSIRLAVNGGASFEWHRLSDNRFYVDLKNVVLGFAPRDDVPPPGGVTSVRVRQIATAPIPIVRVAMTLASQRQIDVVGTSDGIALAVNANDDLEAPRVGAGEINGGMAYAPPPAAATLPISPELLRPGTNPRLIVIDPGHGGSDIGASHNGLVEKDLTLDISRRLKAILISRGWQVKMTRETDVDVFAPNDSARDELQARCDVANAAGARLFVSVHINSSTSASVNGTTSYYYKPSDEPLAAAIQRRLMASLGTADMGTRKEAFYVIKHTSMPATLVETAFISNPSDAELMRSPAFLQRVAQSIADGIGDYTAVTPISAAAGQ